MLHNFCHWVPPTTGENEFSFAPEQLDGVIAQLQAEPLDAWRIGFSFLGFYGVSIFIFLSGFGLARRARGRAEGFGAFLKSRIAAIYPAVCLAAVGYLVYEGIRGGFAAALREDGWLLAGQFFLVGNFLGTGLEPIGPWWFLSVIFQLYCLFPLLDRLANRWGARALWIAGGVALAAEFFLNERVTEASGMNLNFTAVGHLPTFAFGMWAGKFGTLPRRVAALLPAVGLVIFLLGQALEVAWLLSGAAFAAFAVPLAQAVRLPAMAQRFLLIAGALSLPLFLGNGFLRNPLVWYAQQRAGSDGAWLTTIGFSLLFVAVCFVWAWGADRLERLARAKRSPSGGIENS
ncbi:MAG: acyltransferase [Verrucomicrobiales bacterium]